MYSYLRTSEGVFAICRKDVFMPVSGRWKAFILPCLPVLERKQPDSGRIEPNPQAKQDRLHLNNVDDPIADSRGMAGMMQKFHPITHARHENGKPFRFVALLVVQKAILLLSRPV